MEHETARTSELAAMKTWLVVLNWNGREDTLELLDGLCLEPVTALVVDNCSDDGSLDAIHSRHPTVRTLQTGANLGYAGGNNAGIEFALNNGAEIVGVLNNDTLVEPGFLDPLLRELSQSPKVVVSPDIRYADNPDVSWFRGSSIDKRTGWPQHVQPAAQDPAEGLAIPSPVLTGCCIVATAATWRAVGLFDEGMFLMFEDSDWSRRAVEQGFALRVVTRSRIRHKVSRSFTGRANLLGSYYFSRNGTVFAWRHLGLDATVRFLTLQVMKPSVRRLLDPQTRVSALMSYLGVLAALSHRRGPAGRIAYAAARRGVAASARR